MAFFRRTHTTDDWILAEENDQRVILSLFGILGGFALSPLEQALRKVIASHKNTILWVDLGRVPEIVDPRIINLFIQAARRATKRGIQLKLLRANTAISHAFKAVRAPETLFD